MGDEYDQASIEDGFESEERTVGCGKIEDGCAHHFCDCKGCPMAPIDSKGCEAERKNGDLVKITIVLAKRFDVIKDH